VLGVVGGYILASEAVLNSVGAGAMATTAGLIFLLVWLAAPRHGLLAQLRRRRRLRRRFARDLVLLHLRDLPRCSDIAQRVMEQFEWSGSVGRRVLDELEADGLVRRDREHIELTPTGERTAGDLERAYRK
jgi:manganese/zinc/iron transport system permease protein